MADGMGRSARTSKHTIMPLDCAEEQCGTVVFVSPYWANLPSLAPVLTGHESLHNPEIAGRLKVRLAK